MHASDRLKGIDVFMTVVDAASFTAAAERFNLTNAAIGKPVARLEAWLSFRLCKDTTRQLALTDAVQALYRITQRAKAVRPIGNRPCKPSGRPRVRIQIHQGQNHEPHRTTILQRS